MKIATTDRDTGVASQTLKESMEREKVKGFVKVLVSNDVTEGLNILYVSVIL